MRRALIALAAALAIAPPAASAYTNPVPITTPGGRPVETFADPSVIAAPDGGYYAYATGDPLNGADRDATGALRIRRIPFARSSDLVHWTYQGEALAAAPDWASPGTGLWAPDIRRRADGRYLLYFTVTDTADSVSGEPGCDFDPAIGVAVADTPEGPFLPTAEPVVAPRRNGPGCDFKWTFDPDAPGSGVLYYGSYNGGIEARRLSADGLTTDPASARRITTGDRYEGAYVVRHGGWWYLMGSSTDCCRGPLTGYSVFAGRSRSPWGPFRDRLGARLDEPRVGGTPVISMNGNRWVGTGHNAVITDRVGHDWFVYHAIDRTDPYLAAPNPDSILKRHLLIDRLTWRHGWPSVRNGRWASDTPQPDPGVRAAPPSPPRPDRPGRRLDGDEFRRALAPGWSWVRGPAATVRGGRLVFPTAAGDLFEADNTAPVLVRPGPRGDFMVEAKVAFDVPESGVFNYQQAALLLYANDDAFVKLAHVAIGETRQTEWAKEVPQPETPAGQRYGNSVVGPPGATTWLRIARRGDLYTAYTSNDGRRWVHGGTWTNDLGARPRIGLSAFGGTGHTARFDYVRVYRLAARRHRAVARDARASRPSAHPAARGPVRSREQLTAPE
jgi:arabinan endo-1,5-alpha-L-arabinosidase